MDQVPIENNVKNFHVKINQCEKMTRKNFTMLKNYFAKFTQSEKMNSKILHQLKVTTQFSLHRLTLFTNSSINNNFLFGNIPNSQFSSFKWDIIIIPLNYFLHYRQHKFNAPLGCS